MNKQIVDINCTEWIASPTQDKWINDLEVGKVLHFTSLEFPVSALESSFFTLDIRNPKSRNISLDVSGNLKGAAGNEQVQTGLGALMMRFRAQSQMLVDSHFPCYKDHLRLGPTSFRPSQIETRNQSWRTPMTDACMLTHSQPGRLMENAYCVSLST